MRFSPRWGTIAQLLRFLRRGGMVRAGLGPGWRCLFAMSRPEKSAAYRATGRRELKTADVAALAPGDLPGHRRKFAWASFPCPDLFAAPAPPQGARSGTFYAFCSLIERLAAEYARRTSSYSKTSRAPDLASRRGFRRAARAPACARLCLRRHVIDGALFTPQSRPRLFVIAVRRGIAIPTHLEAKAASNWHLPAAHGHAALPAALKRASIWWALPEACRARGDAGSGAELAWRRRT